MASDRGAVPVRTLTRQCESPVLFLSLAGQFQGLNHRPPDPTEATPSHVPTHAHTRVCTRARPQIPAVLCVSQWCGLYAAGP